jgi:SIR2-like protein
MSLHDNSEAIKTASNNASSGGERERNISALSEAFQRGDLALYLGAGVSVANGLPPWDKLVLAMYFAAISPQPMTGTRPFPNYLFAIAEWHLNRAHEPLDITARRIRKYYGKDEDFFMNLRRTLYAGYANSDGGGEFQSLEQGSLRSANPTLNAVAGLCENSVFGTKGVRSVITYNYDNLLETALGSYPFQSFWKSEPSELRKLPIYHVHGFVPIRGNRRSAPKEIVFTEEQYHSAAHDAYSWANLVQIQSMSRSVGLMIGLSLSDRNMRRLLDAIVGLPHHPTYYAFLQEPQWEQPSNIELDQIHEKAQQYKEKFEKSGVKGAGVKGAEWRQQISGIIREVERLDVDEQTYVLNQLGIQPIWYKNHAEIPLIIERIRCS